MPTSHNMTDVFSGDDVKLSVETTRVAGGMANLGIDRHSFARPGQAPTFSVVEKRTQVSSQSRRKYNLYGKIHKACRAGFTFSPLLDSGIAEYTRLTGKNRDPIMFNAYRYALLRLIDRANKYFSAKKHDQFDQEMGVGRKVLADLLTFQR